ncbi:CTD nuclear envelope phosphatase 1 homolog [Ipomoea triloba]|uniref:CTD nuclear envelope phosphatase 1 homolog n=1 Tax=Ipomoea triloba TaxID=35885 RepID=UPI00125DA24D|nr:CTD nuclear envelope phosphatase 1 homolog [Ipomoea triloba]
MVELAKAAKVYAPKTLQLWRTLLNWAAAFYEIFVQSTPSAAQLLSYVGFRNSSFLSSPPPPQFRPLPVVEVEDKDDSPPSSALPSLQIASGCSDEHHLPRLTVVLDLDETLVCAYETSTLPSIILTQAKEAGLKWFELECISSDKECHDNPKINYVTVFERPGLRTFLKELSKFADLVLFTAGLEGYARPVVDKLDVDRLFIRRLYRPSTTSTEYREHVKDLSFISKDLSRIVMVDNNPFSFLLQPLNGIPCVPFSAGQPHDEQLLEVILPLLEHLSQQKDVRPVLYEMFHMPEWFQKHGIPASRAMNEG